MRRFTIVDGPDRLDFLAGLFKPLVNDEPGSRPRDGVEFAVEQDGEQDDLILTIPPEGGKRRKLPMVIREIGRMGNTGCRFQADVYCAHNVFRTLLGKAVLDPWARFQGEYNPFSKQGWIEQVP